MRRAYCDLIPFSMTLTWHQRDKLIGPLSVVIELRPNLLIKRVLEQLVGSERPITISEAVAENGE